MGHLSDRTRTRWGRRRPYFSIAPLPMWLAFYLIWTPAPGLSANGLFLHLLVCYVALYTCWTVFSIPYVSLGMEMTPVYHERTRLFGGRQGFYIAGIAAGMLVPEIFARAAGDPTTGYSLWALGFGGLTVILIGMTFFRVRERPQADEQTMIPFFQGVSITFRNRAFMVLLFVYLVALVGGSFIAPLTL